jgi:hypothetical protein
MKPNGLGDCVSEPSRQPCVTHLFVLSVGASLRNIFPPSVKQMADIVKQCGDDERVLGAVLLGKAGTLKRVLKLRYWLAEIRGVAAGFEKRHDFVGNIHVNCIAVGRAASRSIPTSMYENCATSG